MTNRLLVANFKMNKTATELKEYFSNFPRPKKSYNNTIVFCPAFTGLDYVSRKLKGNLKLGAQNIHYLEDGAYTGEISGRMLEDFGVEYVLIGHSERRIFNGEDNDTINRKVKAALSQGLKVILCVGENAEQRAMGRTNNVLSRQINAATQDIDDLQDVYIAYEPIWAIGAGTAADIEDITKVAEVIKKIIGQPMLYGGSVTENNAKEILSIPNVKGVLVGGGCLDPKQFAKICEVEK